jgi:transglutaminase-like putative cysteine protease
MLGFGVAQNPMTELDANASFRWAIRHETLYRYSTAVVFAPHVLRLSPRSEGVRTLARDLRITPLPVEVTDFDDDFGNICTRVRFGRDAGNELKIESRIEVELLARPVYGRALALSALPPRKFPRSRTGWHSRLAALRSRSSNACALRSIRRSTARSASKAPRRRPRKHSRWAAARVAI